MLFEKTSHSGCFYCKKKTEVDFQMLYTEILQSPLSAYVFTFKKREKSVCILEY